VAVCLLPAAGLAQRGDAATEARLNQLQRTLGELSQQLEQLRRQEQLLQQRLEKMRADYEARLERLEKAGTARPPVRPAATSKPK
jgi:TolA-binding protein